MAESQATPEPAAEPKPDPASEPAPSAEPAPKPDRGRPGRRWWVAGIAIAALVVVVLAPLASSDPDGLQRVAIDQGFIGQAQNFISGLLAGYAIPGIDDPRLSKILSGLLGVAIVLGVMYVLGRVLARRRA
ncbi:MAG TPA: PDGLE domain-containing protein [Candidatus Limnocylindrales bacterium]